MVVNREGLTEYPEANSLREQRIR